MDASVAAADAGAYTRILAERLDAERHALAAAWLDGLKALLPVSTADVFPTDDLLDHIPTLIAEIAGYLGAPEAEAIAANTAVIEKAKELGTLRHAQQATVHQLLREYELLGDVLERFVAAETARLALVPAPATAFEVMRRLTRAVHALMRTTVDTFVTAYVETIATQTAQLRRFTRIASHELRSPVGTLLFAADLLGKDDRADPDRTARLVSIVSGNAQRLRQVIGTLQQVARLDPQGPGVHEQVIEVRALAEDVASQLADMAEARGVAIRIDPHLPILVLDPARLELVLINLLSNAIKYADPAKPARFVALDCHGQTSATCTLAVRDNGLGIPEEAQAHIFHRHFRAHEERDAELGNDGSGLGLPIVAECVEALRGSIRCESRPGHGTTILVELPLRTPPTPPDR